MPVVRLANDKSFEADTGTTLLDAARAAGIVLEHSCRTGRCGSCKARVLRGAPVPVGDQSGLRAVEREAGFILTCGSVAADDTVLDIDDVSELADVPVQTLPCRIDALRRSAPDVVEVALRFPPKAAALRRLAGQYVDVIGPGGVRRSYSIANHGDAAGRIELHVRQVPDGALSAYWFSRAQRDDLLRIQGPKGSFFLRDVADLDVVFLATGTGIAPVKAMLVELAGRPGESQPRSVALYWGGRSEHDLYWTPDFEDLSLRYVPVLSRAADSWPGARGHVQDIFLRESPSLDRAAVYACGSPAMIDSARGALRAAGLPPRRFYADAFVSSSSPSPGKRAPNE